MLSYRDALKFIHGIARFGSKPGLRRVTMLLDRMNRPQDKLKFIHVAGTNGKGSTCTMLSNILAEAGYRTGLYISPFVVDFRERIQINNEMIPEKELAASTATVKAHWDALDAIGETPTEFEVVVAIAFDYFLRMQCDVVVLEVGMGGRFDATNVIGKPLCSIITSISIDHTAYLGDTLEEIAYEKCGIIKKGGVTVSYPKQVPAALGVIMEQCALKNNRLLMGSNADVLHMDIHGTTMAYEGREYHIPLAGLHQVWNTVTVLEAVKAIQLSGVNLTPEEVSAGIAKTRFPSRLEILSKEPLVILDGAHNQDAMAVLSTSLDMLKGRQIHAVVGMMADKEVRESMALLLPHCASYIAVTPDNPRAMPGEELAELCREFCPDGSFCPDKRQALTDALERCGDTGVLLACGSLYLTSELRGILLELLDSKSV